MDRAKHLLHAGLDRKARRGGVRSACRRDDTRELSHGNILVPTFQRSTSDRGTWPCTSLSILLPTSSKGGGQCGPLFFPPSHTPPQWIRESSNKKKKKEQKHVMLQSSPCWFDVDDHHQCGRTSRRFPSLTKSMSLAAAAAAATAISFFLRFRLAPTGLGQELLRHSSSSFMKVESNKLSAQRACQTLLNWPCWQPVTGLRKRDI